MMFTPLAVHSLGRHIRNPIKLALATSAATLIAGCASTPESPSASTNVNAAQAALKLHTVGEGLPRNGQWRSQLAVADVNGDGRADLVLPAPRKSDGRPRVFIAQADGSWKRWAEMRQPRFRYDYGGVAIFDFDGDGRLDLAFGMHLRGVAAMRQQGSAGEFHDASAGLNETADGRTLQASSQSLAVIPPLASGAVARLLVVYEPQNVSGTPGASLWQFGNGRWSRQDVAGAPRGTHAVVANDVAYYLAGGDGVMRVDPKASALTAERVGPLPEGVFAHAFALGTNGDALVSTSRFERDAWVRRVERFPALATTRAGREVLPVSTGVERRSEQRYTAIASTSAAPWGLPGELVAIGSEKGALELLHLNGEKPMLRVGQIEASAWRSYCSVSYLQWAALVANERPRLVATFSGEVSAYDLQGGCQSGGGIDVFAVER